ncbi:beta strand repeat-containing protein [Alicyclobacillus tolerans]|uniref:beta strand repeat-containing protein n=1 Tax=Alicyclobacillus tolerans TaxID=90970 RepID=UPI003B7C557A
MKRALTGIAAASVVLGMSVPTVFAANYSNATWHQETIQVGSTTLGFKGFDALYAGIETNYMPIYYLIEMLQKDGYQASWNGINKVFSITTPSGVNVDTSVFTNPGQGTASIYLNGQLVQMTDSIVKKDPASGGNTTYMPVYFLLKVLHAIGAASQSNWDGNTETLTLQAPTPASMSTSLSAISVGDASVGTGSASSPAVTTGANLTLSTTLTDAMGNPIPGVNTTLVLMGSVAPSVTVNGQSVAATSVSGGWSYQVPTNSNGVAEAQISVATGITASYVAQYQAPYNNNGVQVSSAKSYVEFVPAGGAAISPIGTANSPYTSTVSTPSNETTGLVPVTVTIPSAGSGVEVTFTLSGGSAYFANAQGGEVSAQNAGSAQTIVYTNSNGQATVYVNDNSTDSGVVVSAQATGYSIPDTYLSWGQAGVVTQLANVTASNVSSGSGTNSSPYEANAGSDVVISGQAQDASGNPVSNAQLLLVNSGTTGNPASYVDSNSGAGDYVNGTTSTAFPNVDAGSIGGYTNPSQYGELVTTDANGNFSFTVTDSAIEADHYYLYSVNNNTVSKSPLGNWYVNWQAGTTLNSIGVATTISPLQTNYNGSSVPTSLSGIQVLQGSTAQIEFAGYSGLQQLGANSNETYDASLNSGTIASVTAGGKTVSLNGTNGLSSVSINVVSDGNNQYTVTANGQPVTTSATSPVVTLNVTDSSAETDTLTISSGSVKSTASIQFTSSGPVQAASLTPSLFQLAPGQSGTITYTVEDAGGNPVPDAAATLQLPTSPTDGTNLWLTTVNGTMLQQTESLGANLGNATEPTPIPVGSFTYNHGTPGSVAYSVSIPGVVSWMNGSPYVQVFTNSKGQVTLTFAAGGIGYWNTTTTSVYTSDPADSGLTTSVYTYSNSGTNSDTASQLYVGKTSPWGSSTTTLGQIGW